MSSKFTCWKCKSDRTLSENYEVNQYNKVEGEVKTVMSGFTTFTHPIEYKHYSVVKKLLESNGHIFGKVGKLTKCMDV